MATGDKITVGLLTGPLEYVVKDDEMFSTKVEPNGVLQLTRNGKPVAIFAAHHWRFVTFDLKED
jgi:hypothetical protein